MKSVGVLKSLGVSVLVILLMVLPAVPALAHATLVEATPADGSVVGQGPTDVALHYDQPVGTSFGAVKVLSPDGTRVDTGVITSRDGGSTVVETLHPNLSPGTYTILWRVLSADTHTVFGAVTFSVKTASSTGAASAAEAAQASGGQAADDLLDLSRLVFYLGLLLLIGVLAFLFILWPAGRTVRAARRMLWSAWALAVVGTVGGLLMQGPYSQGLSPYYAFDSQLINEVLPTRFGITSIIRLVLLVVTAVVLLRLGRSRRAVLAGAAGIVSLGLLLSTSVIGHAGTGDLAGLAFPADILHLAGASAWVGGLVFLAFVLLRRRSPADLSQLLPRWSRYAEVAVLVLVVSGTFAAWRQVREWGALTGTTYGRLLLIKTGLVAVMLLLGALGRARVRRAYVSAVGYQPPVLNSEHPSELEHPDESMGSSTETRNGSGFPDHSSHAAFDPGFGSGNGSSGRRGGSVATEVRPIITRSGSVATEVRPAIAPPAITRQLRRSVYVEAGIALVVLAVTAILVSTTPAKDSYFPLFSQSATVTGDLHLQVDVGPAKVGLDEMHFVYTGQGGKPVDVVQVTARWTLQGGDDVVPVTLTRTSLGHYDLQRVELSTLGTWQLAVATQTSDIDSSTNIFTVRIR